EMWPLRCRQMQPGNHLLDARLVRIVIVEMEIIRRPFAGNLRLRSRPEKAGAAHSLFFRQRPQRNAPVPTPITISGRIIEGIALLALGVVKSHADDAVMLGIESGHNR